MTAFDAVASFYEGEILYQNDQRDEARVAWQTAAERAAEMVAADKNDPTAFLRTKIIDLWQQTLTQNDLDFSRTFGQVGSLKHAATLAQHFEDAFGRHR